MKRKIGPLPLYGWLIVVAGAGLVYYLYKRSSTAAGSTAPTLDATAGAPADAGGVGGAGGSSGEPGPPIPPIPPVGATSDDILNALLGLQASVAAIPGGGQGVTDAGAGAGADTPTQTFGGEIGDVVSGIAALQQAGLIPSGQTGGAQSNAAAAARGHHKAKRAPAKKKSTRKAGKRKTAGSGAAGHAGKSKGNPRRTVSHKATPRRPAHPHQAPHPRKVSTPHRRHLTAAEIRYINAGTRH